MAGVSEGSSKGKVVPFTEAEKELQGINIQLAQEQLDSILGQKAFQQQLTQLFAPILQEQAQRLGQSGEVANAGLQRLLNIVQGSGVSPEQSRLLDESLNREIEGIRSSTRQNLELVKQELAPATGLRAGDSPIIDRGGRVAEVGIQAESEARARRAQAELALPFTEGQFLQGLNDADFLQRLQFGQQQQTGGLGLATIGNVAAQQQSLKPITTTSSQNTGFSFG